MAQHEITIDGTDFERALEETFQAISAGAHRDPRVRDELSFLLEDPRSFVEVERQGMTRAALRPSARLLALRERVRQQE